MSNPQLPARPDLRVGEEKELTMPGVGVSGYVWQATVEGQPGLVKATLRRGLREISPRIVGLAAPEILLIRALSAGEVRLDLSQKRPWEREAPPLRTHRIIVTVKSHESNR